VMYLVLREFVPELQTGWPDSANFRPICDCLGTLGSFLITKVAHIFVLLVFFVYNMY
jgi:hypothetical protein